jgi:hypothetical protein
MHVCKGRRNEMKRVWVLLTLVSALAVCGTATGVYLMAGQHYEAGWVEASADLETLTVTITVDEGWVLEETHVYVGTEPPVKSAPGRFPYKHEKLEGAQMDTYSIDLEDFDVACDAVLYVAVHAVVTRTDGENQTETAWGEGEYIRTGKNWAMYFPTEVICEVEEPR